MNERIRDKVSRFPTGPGIYIFTDRRGKALYVGKASNLRSRVRAYMRPGGDGRRLIAFLEHSADDVEFVATQTEQEALLLEDTVVKKRKPLFNVKLKDDKAFLLLRLDRGEEWPWFRLVRRRRTDGAEYFGPYASAKSVRRTLRLLHKVVPLRDCKDSVFNNRSRPCLKFDIGRCPAPCVGAIGRGDYEVLLEEAVAILRGAHGPVLERLERQMAEAAEALEFERAQAIKLQIDALARVSEKQAVVDARALDQDVVGLHRSGEDVTLVVLQFRAGRLESSRRFEFGSRLPNALLFSDFLARYYHGDAFVPHEVLVPDQVAEAEIVEQWLASKRGTKVRLHVPQRGVNRRHLEMAMENARLAEQAAVDAGERRAGAARALAQRIGMAVAPTRIHCIDISTTQGRQTVGSRVSFVDGKPHKATYRRYKLSLDNAGDDFSAMTEVVTRSLTRAASEDRDALPDLLVVDGGRGQVQAALRALDELGLVDDVPVVGLAKARLRGERGKRKRTDERLVLPEREEPIVLPDGEIDTLLVTAIRDEAHRFAIEYHRKLRGRIGSQLDEIEGVGPTRRRALLRHFGSLTAVQNADREALRAVPGLPEAVAERILAWGRPQDDEASQRDGG